MRKLFLFVSMSFILGSLSALAQKKEPAKTLTPEEIAAQELEERRSMHAEEMLENTRKVCFIDSLVVDKDAFLSRLRLTKDAGRFTDPNSLSRSAEHPETGRAGFVNSMSTAVYFSAADASGNIVLQTAYRTGKGWSAPQPISELTGFSYMDYPFLCSDGVTLYFSAEGEESIGGLDVFVTRYNNNSRQFVRPENVGFPWNSTANDYLLAIDETAGIGALVTDRRQPDDKVCIYWFIAQNFDKRSNYAYDEDDEEAMEHLRNYAAIMSIAQTQSLASKQTIAQAKDQWAKALETVNSSTVKNNRYIINDAIVYNDLTEFKVANARAVAAKWTESSSQLNEMLERLDKLREDYAMSHSSKLESEIRNLEVQTVQLRLQIGALAKEFRAAELGK